MFFSSFRYTIKDIEDFYGHKFDHTQHSDIKML